MAKAIRITTTILACLALLIGCRSPETASDQNRKPTHHRSTIIIAPGASPAARPPQMSPNQPSKAEPGMSMPPAEAPSMRPRATPVEAPARRNSAPTNPTDLCGRPLLV